ncbi:MAG: nucleotide exchange factor GrpE [Methylotenera sp.]|nr:nucleotide exchange factor GrpE [Oligoflexia bacterium]
MTTETQPGKKEYRDVSVEPADTEESSTQGEPQQTGAQSTDSGGVNSAESRLAALEAQVKEKEAKYVYLYAEFENFKKRAIKERQDAMKYGWENVARDLLAVVDNLERALSHMPEATDKNLRVGLEMVMNQFKAAMQKQGVQQIETQNQAFDPNLHEAMAQEASDQPQGQIVKQMTSGYTLNGRLLRPAQVVISAGNTN